MAASAVLLQEKPIATTVAARRGKLARIAVLLAASVLVLALGGVEDVYGNTDRGDVYGADAVQYLDVARAIERHDWHSALNPLWSQGYPALLAVARPLFAAGPMGDWHDTRSVNFAIFAADYAAFLYLLFGLWPSWKESAKGRRVFVAVGALTLFVTTQICIGQVSRVNPDELVNTLFFLAMALIVRLLHGNRERVWRYSVALGVVLAVGFVVKAAFLMLGCCALALTGFALWRRGKSRVVFAAAAIFAIVVAGYGTALSRAFGHRTLGEAGAINYVWHVDRLQKWVHWQGGNLPADEAWPKPSIARFAQWDSRPPDFGLPLHPTKILQTAPVVYGFAAPIHATYVPYFDPPYFYDGYHRVVRWRYQVIAIGKSLGDLAKALLAQPAFFGVLLAVGVLAVTRRSRQTGMHWLRAHWVVFACSLFGVALFVPVHLEGRYLASFLAVLGLCALLGAAQSSQNNMRWRVATLLVALGLTGSVVRYQTPVWRNLLHYKTPESNPEWLVSKQAMAEGLPEGAQIGVISWTPNLQSDWAYIAHLEITSEIGSGPDFDLFWRSSPAQQQQTLETFRRSGAIAVFAKDKPPTAGASVWKHLPSTNTWMYRF